MSTKGELIEKGANIPTAWLLIVPFVSIWWMWKYFEGAEQVTSEKVNGVLMFILAVFITSLISSALCQDAYNNLSDVSAPQDPVTAPDAVAFTESGNKSTVIHQQQLKALVMFNRVSRHKKILRSLIKIQ